MTITHQITSNFLLLMRLADLWPILHDAKGSFELSSIFRMLIQTHLC